MAHIVQTTPAGKTLLHKPIVHILLIVITGLIAYSNTFHVPFQFDDINNIVKNSFVQDLRYFTEPSKAKTAEVKGVEYYAFKYDGFKNRFIGFLTFALNYKAHGLNVTGYHIVNLAIHIINALLVYWLVVLTLQTPWFNVIASAAKQSPSPEIASSRNTGTRNDNGALFQPSAFNPHPSLIALFSSLLFISHPIQTETVTYIIQRLTSLATLFYLLSLVMYVKFRMQDAGYRIQDKESKNRVSCIVYLVSLISAVLAMKTKEIALTLPIIIVLYEIFFFSKSQIHPSPTRLTPYALRFLYLTPFLLTLLIIPLSHIEAPQSAGDLFGDISETVRVQTDMSRLNYLFTEFRVIVTYIRLLFLPINQNLDYDYPVYNSFLNPHVFLSFLFLLSIFGLGVYLFYCSKLKNNDTGYKIQDTGYTTQNKNL